MRQPWHPDHSEVISGELTIINRLGLHARAATRLVNCASEFESEVRIIKGARCVNGKSIMGVLTLAAAKGTALIVETEGPDAQEAFGAISELIGNCFEEED
jgi:phosphocarrier protein